MSTPITNITGIGPAAAVTLAKHGFDSAEDIASSDVESLCRVPGFKAVRAQGVIKAAKAIASIEKKKANKPKPGSKTPLKSPKTKDKKKSKDNKKGKEKSKSKPTEKSKKSKKSKKKSGKKKDSKKSKSKKKGKGKK